MATFAHTFKSLHEASLSPVVSGKAAYTLVLHRSDGTIEVVNSDELPAIANETNAISMAMNSLNGEDEHCDVFHFGEDFGTAEYLDMTPDSWFSGMQVVFSEAW